MIFHINMFASAMLNKIFRKLDCWAVFIENYSRFFLLEVKLFKDFLQLIAWRAYDVAATNSILIVDEMTIDYFFDDQEKTLEPNMKIYLEVFFRSSQ